MTVPRWPTHYLSGDVLFAVEVWRLHRESAIPPLRLPSFLWPPRLVETFRLLDRESAAARGHP